MDLVPTQYCPTFSANGNKEISCLGKQFFPNVSNDSVLGQWNDFNFEMIKNDKNIATEQNQVQKYINWMDFGTYFKHFQGRD